MKRNKNPIISANAIVDMLVKTADKAINAAEANSILGKKITVEDTAIIPISNVSVGIAGGGSKDGLGTGSKVDIKPLSFLVIKENKVKVIKIEVSKTEQLTKEIINRVLEKFKAEH